MDIDIQTKFYDNILKDKDNIIDYYVKQYGEENRMLLEERFDKIKFFFCITPQNYHRYLRKKYTLFFCYKIQELLEEIGIDKSKLKLEDFGEYCLSGKDDSTTKILETFWDNPTIFVGYGEDQIRGVWCFLSDVNMDKVNSYAKYRNITPEEYLEKSRCKFFKKLGLFPKELSNIEIRKDIKYKELCQKYSQIADNWKRRLETVKESLQDEFDLYDKLIEGYVEAKRSSVREVILEDLADLLDENDRRKIANDPAIDPLELDITYFLIGSYKNLDIPGLYEAFDDEDTKLLLDKNVSYDIKNIILENRITYFKKKNISINIDEALQKKLITSNWSDIDEVKDYLPSPEIIERMKTARKKAYEKYKIKFAKVCFIDGNATISETSNNDIIDLSDLAYSACTTTKTEDGKVLETTIYFDPYIDKPTNLDIHLRHEIRHALTTSSRLIKDNITEIKIGNKIEIFQDEKNISNVLSDYNEWVTQEEALKETKRAYEEGRYIITPKGSSFPKKKTSDYDYDLPIFKLLYDKLPTFAKKSQIDSNNDSLYEAIELADLKYIEDQILQNTLSEDDVTSRLKTNYTVK